MKYEDLKTALIDAVQDPEMALSKITEILPEIEKDYQDKDAFEASTKEKTEKIEKLNSRLAQSLLTTGILPKEEEEEKEEEKEKSFDEKFNEFFENEMEE